MSELLDVFDADARATRQGLRLLEPQPRAPADWGDVLGATWESTKRHFFFAEEDAASDKWAKTLDLFRERTGRDLPNPYSVPETQAPIDEYSAATAPRQELTDLAIAALDEARREHPDLPDPRTFGREVVAERQAADQELAAVMDVASTPQRIGSVVAGAIMSQADPTQLMLLPLGAAKGASLLRILVTEGALGAAGQAIASVREAQRYREDGVEDVGLQIARDIGLGFLGGAVVGGGVSLAGRGAARAFETLDRWRGSRTGRLTPAEQGAFQQVAAAAKQAEELDDLVAAGMGSAQASRLHRDALPDALRAVEAGRLPTSAAERFAEVQWGGGARFGETMTARAEARLVDAPIGREPAGRITGDIPDAGEFRIAYANTDTRQRFTVRGEVTDDAVRVVMTSDGYGSARGAGGGVEAYQHLADRALAAGKELRSDTQVSRDAAAVYDALERRGYTVVRDPDAVLHGDTWSTMDPNADIRAIADEKARARTVFRVTAGPAPDERAILAAGRRAAEPDLRLVEAAAARRLGAGDAAPLRARVEPPAEPMDAAPPPADLMDDAAIGRLAERVREGDADAAAELAEAMSRRLRDVATRLQDQVRAADAAAAVPQRIEPVPMRGEAETMAELDAVLADVRARLQTADVSIDAGDGPVSARRLLEDADSFAADAREAQACLLGGTIGAAT